ncbi:unnamed protein product [Dimorphilus gyrociliatus]|uniref:Uncharacterized protein n=1 Tax=Dimorphilus gyrociliatus TaxID=2664684 RepID=A0A7I8VAX9_9ANNE|nr:unnamed protein product [Dimorphilus gyrociliatus]
MERGSYSKRLTSETESRDATISLKIGEIVLSDDLSDEEGRSRYLHALFHIPTLLRDNFDNCQKRLDDILKQHKSSLLSVETEIGSGIVEIRIKDENPVALQVAFSSGQLLKDVKSIIISKEFTKELGILDLTLDIQLL